MGGREVSEFGAKLYYYGAASTDSRIPGDARGRTKSRKMIGNLRAVEMGGVMFLRPARLLHVSDGVGATPSGMSPKSNPGRTHAADADRLQISAISAWVLIRGDVSYSCDPSL